MYRFFLIVIFSLLACVVNAQARWDYPVKPGMEEWKKFQSNEEMVNVCQIPENILSSLSTEELTELCLEYLLLWDIFAFNNLNHGVDKLFRDFNGIRELYKRKDVSSSLTKRYIQKVQSFSFLDEEHSDFEKGFFIISVSALEVLLSRVEWQENDEKDSLKGILQNLVAGYEEKLKFADDFKGFGFQTNFYSRSHVITKMNKSTVERLPQKEKNFTLVSGMADEQSINVINEMSYQLIK